MCLDLEYWSNFVWTPHQKLSMEAIFTFSYIYVRASLSHFVLCRTVRMHVYEKLKLTFIVGDTNLPLTCPMSPIPFVYGSTTHRLD